MSRIAMNMPKHITTKAATLRLLEMSALPAPPVGERAETGSASVVMTVLMTMSPPSSLAVCRIGAIGKAPRGGRAGSERGRLCIHVDHHRHAGPQLAAR